MICEQPATIHETTIEAGVATSRHFYHEHSESPLPPVDPALQAASLRAMEEYYHSLSDAEREHMALLHRFSRRGL